jgi:ribosomal protein L21E
MMTAFSEMTKGDIVDVSLDTDSKSNTPSVVFHGVLVKFGYVNLAFVVLDNMGFGWFNKEQVVNIVHTESTDIRLKNGVGQLIESIKALLEAFQITYK